MLPATQSEFDYDTLKKHQVEFLEFGQKIRKILCGDSMGLGKTYEGIAIDAVRRYQQTAGNIKGYKTLVIAPLSGVVDSWVRHFEKLTDLTVRRVDNTSKKARLSFIDTIKDPEVDVLVIHWECLQQRLGLLETLQEVRWLHVIADESHKAKNRKAQQSKGLKSINRNADFVTEMTGTPMKNTPIDIWSLIDALFPSRAEKRAIFGDKYYKLFTSYWNFYDKFLQWEETYEGYRVITGTKNEALLQELIKPFYIRRTKDLIRDWPEKYYSTRYVDLSAKQRKPYDQMKGDMLAWLGEQGDQPLPATVVIAQLIRLQQMALGYCHVEQVEIEKEDEESVWTEVHTKVTKLEAPSAKLDALLQIIDEMGGDKIVVFSQFSKMIDLTEETLNNVKEGKTYKYRGKVAKITGDVPPNTRDGIVQEFQHGDTQIMLCTIGAGGTGIDLYAASTGVFLDRAWSPADNEQAEDRMDRIGQTQAVHIIDIVANNTIDRERGATIQMKSGWIKNFLEEKTDAV